MKVEIYDKGNSLIAEWEVDEEFCKKLGKLNENSVLFELATGIALSLREEGIDLTPNMILNEWGKVVVCGKEIKLV